MKFFKPFLQTLIAAAIVVAVGTALWFYRDRLFGTADLVQPPEAASAEASDEPQTVLEISSRARQNLSLVAAPARPQSYWRTVVIPGIVAERPGISDRGVTSPAVGVVTAISVFPGDTVRPGETLFTLRLFSEYLQNTQTQLFKATQEINILQDEIDRLSSAVTSGAVSQNRLIDLRANLKRQHAIIHSSRQDLLTRGLLPEQLQQVEQAGQFVSTIDVTAPPTDLPPHSPASEASAEISQASLITDTSGATDIAYEVQELSVEMGQQVEAGQLLAKLSNHRLLYVVGHAFKRESPFLAKAAQENRPLQIDFADDEAGDWPEMQATFQIRHLSNSIDPDSRTFDFFIPLTNQSHAFEEAGELFLEWRFRPGQRARIQVPVEKFDDVFVLPSDAVVREGPETYVFRQNGDLFKRLPVHVVQEDRSSVVVANDGSITVGSYLAQNSAASLNRVLKAQTASGEQPGVHVHADGTVHAAH